MPIDSQSNPTTWHALSKATLIPSSGCDSLNDFPQRSHAYRCTTRLRLRYVPLLRQLPEQRRTIHGHLLLPCPIVKISPESTHSENPDMDCPTTNAIIGVVGLLIGAFRLETALLGIETIGFVERLSIVECVDSNPWLVKLRTTNSPCGLPIANSRLKRNAPLSKALFAGGITNSSPPLARSVLNHKAKAILPTHLIWKSALCVLGRLLTNPADSALQGCLTN